jgi:hypothetical protein
MQASSFSVNAKHASLSRFEATPKAVKQAQRAMHPVSNAIYDVERSLNTKRRRKSRSPVYHYGTCTVSHRTPEAAAKCRRTI